MYKSLLIVEDKDGNEHKGFAKSHWGIELDQMTTIQLYNSRFVSGFVVEILGEEQYD